MRVTQFLILAPALLLVLSSLSCNAKEERKIYLIPVGEVEKEILDYLAFELSCIFPYHVEIKKSLPKPGYAHNKRRNQYCADLVLEKLKGENPEKEDKILGVADLDLYTPGLNFVFGVASLNGKASLIALPRLRQEFYGLSENKELYCERAVKEAVHELGHTFGLSHCKNPRCVMHFSNSLYDTDRKGKEFCKSCRKKLPF